MLRGQTSKGRAVRDARGLLLPTKSLDIVAFCGCASQCSRGGRAICGGFGSILAMWRPGDLCGLILRAYESEARGEGEVTDCLPCAAKGRGVCAVCDNGHMGRIIVGKGFAYVS